MIPPASATLPSSLGSPGTARSFRSFCPVALHLDLRRSMGRRGPPWIHSAPGRAAPPSHKKYGRARPPEIHSALAVPSFESQKMAVHSAPTRADPPSHKGRRDGAAPFILPQPALPLGVTKAAVTARPPSIDPDPVSAAQQVTQASVRRGFPRSIPPRPRCPMSHGVYGTARPPSIQPAPVVFPLESHGSREQRGLPSIHSASDVLPLRATKGSPGQRGIP